MSESEIAQLITTMHTIMQGVEDHGADWEYVMQSIPMTADATMHSVMGD